MNKKTNRYLFILCILLAAAPVFARQGDNPLPVVALTGIINRTGIAAVDSAASVLDEAFRLNISVTGKYTALRYAESQPPATEAEMPEFCAVNDCDYLLRGDITGTGGDITIAVTVFSVKDSSIIITEAESAKTPSALRSSAEKLLARVLSGLTGEAYGFGSVSFLNTGEVNGLYSVFVDNVYAGDNLEYIDYITSGQRNIKLTQIRLGKKHYIADMDIVVSPADRISIEFEINGLSDAEKKLTGRFEKPVYRFTGNKYKSQKVGNAFENLFTLLENPEFCEEAVLKKEEILEKYDEWTKNMKNWGLERGLTVADLPYSMGLKGMAVSATLDSGSWDYTAVEPETGGGVSWGGGFFGGADINRFLGIQGEFLFYNLQTSTLYGSGYPLAGAAKVEASAWFVEFPVIVYFRVPSYLLKFYGGVSYKYRITPMNRDIEDLSTGQTDSSIYDESNLRMQNGSWLAGGALEFPAGSSIFFIDFRYNSDFYSWFDSSAPEENFMAGYVSWGLGYSFKAGR